MIRNARSILALALLAASASAHAQTQFPGFRYTVSAAPDQYGVYSLVIENRSKIPITAVHAFRSCVDVEETDHSSGTTGSDSLIRFLFKRPAYIVSRDRSLIRPGESIQMDFPVIDKRCPQGVSVLFEDGHGEGNDNPDFGWHQMIADRFSVFAELMHTQRLVGAIDGAAPDYPQALLGVLDDRRLALATRGLRDVPRSQVRSRSEVLGELLARLHGPKESLPVELQSRDMTLTLLEKWMEPLKAMGYDKPLASASPSAAN